MLSWKRLEVEPAKNVAPWWSQFCSFEKPDTVDETFFYQKQTCDYCLNLVNMKNISY